MEKLNIGYTDFIYGVWYKRTVTLEKLSGKDIDGWLYNAVVVAVALIVYGVAFIVVERLNKRLRPRITDVNEIDYRTALLIGAFQCLSLIPGTSRSGATILGAIILGVSRDAGAEFSFFLAVPPMRGASLYKTAKFVFSGAGMTFTEFMVLVTGCVVSFAVSMFVIRKLMEYVHKADPKAFVTVYSVNEISYQPKK